MPGAEVLGRELVADLDVNVLVDFVGADIDPFAAGAEGEQVLGAVSRARRAAASRIDWMRRWPLLAGKSKTTSLRLTVTCSRRTVARPKLSFSSA
jgi:hypothetical protein